MIDIQNTTDRINKPPTLNMTVSTVQTTNIRIQITFFLKLLYKTIFQDFTYSILNLSPFQDSVHVTVFFKQLIEHLYSACNLAVPHQV